MGIIEIADDQLIVRSHIIIYGNAANAQLAADIRDEIENMWNEPRAAVRVKDKHRLVKFSISAAHMPDIQPEEILGNTDPLNNYFRVETFAEGNISFVDGLGCNTGYFLAENLYKGSTTAAHEYGHTLGLPHPHDMDFRGKGAPGIMYPRGTLVDAQYQYDPLKPAGVPGGTMHPIHRRVRRQDVDDLKLHRLSYSGKFAVLGSLSSIWHPDHRNHFSS